MVKGQNFKFFNKRKAGNSHTPNQWLKVRPLCSGEKVSLQTVELFKTVSASIVRVISAALEFLLYTVFQSGAT